MISLWTVMDYVDFWYRILRNSNHAEIVAHAEIIVHGLLFSVLNKDKVTPLSMFNGYGMQILLFCIEKQGAIFAVIVRKIVIFHEFFTPIFVHEEVKIIVTHAEIVAHGPGRLKQ
jgi:hypothetical protein